MDGAKGNSGPRWLGSLTPGRAVATLVVIGCAALGWYALSQRGESDVSEIDTLARAKQIEGNDSVTISYPGSEKDGFAERNWASLDRVEPSGPPKFVRPAGPVSYSEEAETFRNVRGIAVYVE